MARYWIVGANVDNQDMTEEFVKHGIWFADASGAQKQIPKIRIGDRMAIKRLIGPAAKRVAIRAVGVVENVESYAALPFKMVYVRWIPLEDDRKVPFNGWAASIHGPYSRTATRIKGVFSI